MKKFILAGVIIAVLSGCGAGGGAYKMDSAPPQSSGAVAYSEAPAANSAPSASFDYADSVAEDSAYDYGAEMYTTPSSVTGSGSGMQEQSYSSEPASAPVASASVAGSQGGTTQSTLMFIKTANISLKTYGFESDISEVRNIVDTYGGYFEASNLYTPSENQGTDKKQMRRYNATIRVPVANYELAKTAIEGIGRVYSSNESSKEVSAEYFNIQSRLETLKTEEARLMEFIDEATDMRLIIELEQRLAETKTQIELYEGQLARIESLTSFSTIILNVEETTEEEDAPPPVEETPPPPDDRFIARLTRGFKGSVDATVAFLQGVAVFLAYVIVPVLFVAVLAVIVRFAVKRFRKTA